MTDLINRANKQKITHEGVENQNSTRNSAIYSKSTQLQIQTKIIEQTINFTRVQLNYMSNCEKLELR